MAMCFVIQPFDNGGKFDRRYRETFKPALERAGLETYRVDEDPAVEVPIDEIEGKVAEAAICLADISNDNPNVWYELGFAFALKKKVVLICSDERDGNFPFDIRHRQVISYETKSSSDYEALAQRIEKKATALLESNDRRRPVDAPAERSGSTEAHVRLLHIAAELMPIPGDSISVRDLKNEADKIGIDGISFGLAFRKLQNDGFMERHDTYFVNNETYEPVELTEAGWNWINDNRHLFPAKQ